MSTPSNPTKILIAGLQVHATIPPYFRTLYGTPTEIANKIDADKARVEAAGYHVTTYYMDDGDPQTGLTWLTEKLQAEKFDGVMIGSGLRLIPEQTELFENVVDVVRRLSPGSVMMFNDGPGGNWEALRRNEGALRRTLSKTA
jgi:hypothetical protein